MSLPAAAQPDDDERKKSRNHFCIPTIHAMGANSIRDTASQRLASTVTILFCIDPSLVSNPKDRRYVQNVGFAASVSSGGGSAVTEMQSIRWRLPGHRSAGDFLTAPATGRMLTGAEVYTDGPIRHSRAQDRTRVSRPPGRPPVVGDSALRRPGRSVPRSVGLPERPAPAPTTRAVGRRPVAGGQSPPDGRARPVRRARLGAAPRT